VLSRLICSIDLNSATRVCIEMSKKEAEKDTMVGTMSDGFIVSGKNKGMT
jgi:hypothetical protein